ncbi:MAG: hypothetical protein WD738_00815 [Pirellulales bacterium]
MNRHLFALALGAVLCVWGVTQAAVYDDVYWIGGDGEWTGDVTANPEYSTGHWSNDPNAASGLPAKFVLGRTDGIRVGQVAGAGGFDLDRVPCNEPGCTTTPIPGGTQLGTDMYITTGATVNYNPNRMLLTGDDGLDRFGDFRIQPDANFPGTPTLNLSNGSVFEHQTTFGGDIDGMWTRWNGAELNLDGEGTAFRRTGDAANGFASGAWMFASYHGYANSSQTVHITNGARFENQGQVWFGISGNDVGEENQPGIRVVVTINDGHMDLTGGDEYALDNDNFLTRGDLSFIYDWTYDTDPTNDETLVINFTGPGDITVDGEDPSPIDVEDGTYTQAELDAEFGAGRGGIRVAHQVATGIIGMTDSDYGNDRNIQRSYQDLWDMGILRANNKSGLTGDDFDDFFTTTNMPGDNDYKLTSLVVATPTLEGDYNKDGKVDAADYVIWRKTLGSTTDLAADGDGSLKIDVVDYMYWKRNFGNMLGSGSGAGSLAGVPEPGTMLLLIVGLAPLLAFRSRVS